MKNFKFFRDNKNYYNTISFPFDCIYNITIWDDGHLDLENFEDKFNNLNEQQMLSLFDELRKDNFLSINENDRAVCVKGYHSDGCDCLEIQTHNCYGECDTQFIEL